MRLSETGRGPALTAAALLLLPTPAAKATTSPTFGNLHSGKRLEVVYFGPRGSRGRRPVHMSRGGQPEVAYTAGRRRGG